MNLAQQIGDQQAMANMMFVGDRVPQRHMEAYQQVPEVQPCTSGFYGASERD